MGVSLSFYSAPSKTSKMSTSTTGAISTFNKSKEDFIWWVKKAVADRKSYSYSELYHSLLKMFAEADTNNDGLVSKESFSKLVDAAGALPRAYGFAPQDSDLYKTPKEKEDARQKMFDSMDKKETGAITFDEWLAYCLEHILAKPPTPLLTTVPWTNTRPSSSRPSPRSGVPRTWSCTGSCWSCSLTATPPSAGRSSTLSLLT